MVTCEFLIPYGLTLDPLHSFLCVSYIFFPPCTAYAPSFCFPSPTRNTDNTDSSLLPRYPAIVDASLSLLLGHLEVARV
jgi:hypothetical protein